MRLRTRGPIRDDFAEGAKVRGHLLEPPAVICNGQITLREATEFGVEVEGARLAVAEELCFHSEPGIAREMAPVEMVSARSSEMEPRIQDFTTQSMHTQSGRAAARGASERTWSRRENLPTTRRNWSFQRA